MDVAIHKIWFEDSRIFVELNDKRIIGVPVSWYPRLEKANAIERMEYELWNNGKWIHWEKLDEDLSVEGFLSYQLKNTA